jgi:hypothetical protein
MSRFEDATNDVINMVEKIKKEVFDQLLNAKIKILMDTKKRKIGGKYVLGRIKKTNDELKALALNEHDEPYDYILFLDKVVFNTINDIDKIRLIRHELQHCEVDVEADNPYKIKGHEVEDFHDEIIYNQDDPRWGERIAIIADSIYENDES